MTQFIEEYNALQQEIRDLKTAQPKGFGAMNFYKKSVNYTSPASPSYADSFITITATAAAGEVAPFFCQLAFSGTQDLVAMGLTTTSTSIKWLYYYNNVSATNFTFTSIATSDFTLTVQRGEH